MKHAPSLEGGREEAFSSVPSTHTLQLWLFSLQGCHSSKESSLNPQSSYWLRHHSFRAPSPAVALCPSPCTHTHFPLHTDAAQLTRGQAAGVSKPPKARPGRKETWGQSGSQAWASRSAWQAQQAPLTIFLMVQFQEQTSICSHFTPPTPTLFAEQFSITNKQYLHFLLFLGRTFSNLLNPSALSWNFRYLLASLRWRRPAFCSYFTKELWNDSLLGALLLSCILKKWHWNWGWGQMFQLGPLERQNNH